VPHGVEEPADVLRRALPGLVALVLADIDAWAALMRALITQRVSQTLGLAGDEYAFDLRLYGHNAVLGDLEPESGPPRIFRIPSLNVVKISFPRPVSQDSLRDRDMHAGQHHVPLARMVIPAVS
jgi:hypothetical protein